MSGDQQLRKVLMLEETEGPTFTGSSAINTRRRLDRTPPPYGFEGAMDVTPVKTLHPNSPVSVASSSSKSSQSRMMTMRETLENTLLENPQYQGRERKRKVPLIGQLTSYMRKNGLKTEKELRLQMAKEWESEYTELWKKIESSMAKRKIIACTIDNVQDDIHMEDKTYMDRLKEAYASYNADEDTIKLADEWEGLLSLNSIDPKDFWQKAFAVFKRDGDLLSGKQLTLYMEGVPNAGKSAFTSLFTALYEDYEIGVIPNQSVDSQFWMMDLVGKKIYVAEEMRLTPDNVHSSLKLFEGNAKNRTETKFGGHKDVERHPLIITNNLPLNYFVQQHTKALKARIQHFYFDIDNGEDPCTFLYQAQDILVRILCEFYARYMH